MKTHFSKGNEDAFPWRSHRDVVPQQLHLLSCNEVIGEIRAKSKPEVPKLKTSGYVYDSTEQAGVRGGKTYTVNGCQYAFREEKPKKMYAYCPLRGKFGCQNTWNTHMLKRCLTIGNTQKYVIQMIFVQSIY